MINRVGTLFHHCSCNGSHIHILKIVQMIKRQERELQTEWPRAAISTTPGYFYLLLGYTINYT